MPTPTKIVDSHQHVCWHRRNAAGLVADLDAHGVAYAWLLTWLIGPAEEDPRHHSYLNPALHENGDTNPGVTLSEIVAALEKFPGRFVPGFCPNPTWRNAVALLEAAYHMHGVRICAEWKFRQLFDDPRSLEIFHAAGRLKIPVVLHLDWPYLPDGKGGRVYQDRWYGGTVENLERALQACPETIFVGHAPGFWREISGGADGDTQPYPSGPVVPRGRLYRLFAAYPNLYADLSAGSGRIALSRDPKHAADFIAQHSERLLFGRDIYGRELHDFLKTLPLSSAVLENIYWRNAERLVPAPACPANPTPQR